MLPLIIRIFLVTIFKRLSIAMAQNKQNFKLKFW